MKLAELLDRTGLDVLDHLERQVAVPVVDGLQAQGDLAVIPWAEAPEVAGSQQLQWNPLPARGLEIVRGTAGNNAHTLVADPGTCWVCRAPRDRAGLAVALVHTTATAYLVHPEHGASGIAPGYWVLRRQQEYAPGVQRPRLVAD